jgi:hypothetical protein
VIATPKHIEIKEFAKRVERLCDFLLSQVPSEETGSADISVIQVLKDDAADIQFDRAHISQKFNGLDNYMKGLDKES